MVRKEGYNKEDFIQWFSEIHKDSVPIAGGKGANLGEMYNLGIPVPPGFVVTTEAYHYFIDKSRIGERIQQLLEEIDLEDTDQLTETTKQIREMIISSEMPKDLQDEIIEAYEILSAEKTSENESALNVLKKQDYALVAARSSATAEDLADASFAGQQESFLNVQGKEDLLEHIRKCFASLFTARATYYRTKKGFDNRKVGLAVVVQRMVKSDKSGVMFSKDPSFNNENVIIEAVFGLGEGIVSGTITPDRYAVSRDFEILKREISDKKIAMIKTEKSKKEIVKLSEEMSKAPTLSEYDLNKLAEFALKLEKHYNKPQDIEFAIEDGKIYIVQTRAITTIAKRVDENSGNLSGEILLKGIPASPGIAVGKVKIIKDLSHLGKVEKGDILVTKMTNPDMVVTMQKSAGIVTDEGGLTSHAAIVSREMGIPAIVGTRQATEKLVEGEIVTVDGTNGKVYLGKVAEMQQKEVLPVTANTRTKIKVMVDLPSFAERAAKTGLKGVGLLRMEGIIAESGKHPAYFLQQNKISDYEKVIYDGISEIGKYFDELWVRTSDIRSDEFRNLEGANSDVEINPMLGMHGVRFSLKNPEIFKAELKALKRVSENGEIIGVLLPQVISVEEVQQVKKILQEIHFNNARVGVMVETPAAVEIIRELCEEGIDFISFGTNDLTQYTLAIDRGNEQVQHLYNEMNPAVLHQLEYVIRICKKNKVETSICGQAGSKKEMVEFLVKNGIDSISVNADVAAEIAEFVLEIESKMPQDSRNESKEKVNIF